MMVSRGDIERTITFGDASICIVERGYIKRGGGCIWWKASYLHAALESNSYTLPINKFMQSWGIIVGRTPVSNERDFVFRPTDSAALEHDLINEHLISTRGLALCLLGMCSTNQIAPALKRTVRCWLGALTGRALILLAEQNLTVTITTGDAEISVLPTGEVLGWARVVDSLNPGLKQQWRLDRVERQAEGAVSFLEIVRFCVGFARAHAASMRSRQIIGDLLNASVALFIAPYFERYVLEVYWQTHDVDALPMLIRSPQRRIAGGIDPAVAWEALERSRRVARASVRTVVGVLGADTAMQGLALKNANSWGNKELDCYITKHSLSLSCIKKLCLGADASIFSGQDTLMGIIYSWELDAACIAVPQIMAPNKNLDPDDFECPDELRALAVNRKIVRLRWG